MKGISIIICCYNSSLRLPTTLRYIAEQQVNTDIEWELILVNNASTDDTETVAQSEWAKYLLTIPFQIVRQPIPGLSAAREKGIEVSKFDYILFCDDDNWLDKNYVNIAFETIASHPDAGIVGGQSSGFFEIPEPFWFDKFSQSYVVEKPMTSSGYLPAERDYLAGAGLIIRKELYGNLQKLRFKPMLTGRIGKSLMSGEDYELCLISKFMGYSIYFEERLCLVHYMPKERLSWGYCLQMTTHGHAIPEIYFDTYKSLFLRSTVSSPISFKTHFKKLLFKYSYEIVKPNGFTLKNVLKLPFRFIYFIKKVKGSTEQRRLLSAKNKLVFLLKNKKLFKQQFIEMQELIYKIQNLRDKKSQN